jgi:hypothetical protein
MRRPRSGLNLSPVIEIHCSAVAVLLSGAVGIHSGGCTPALNCGGWHAPRRGPVAEFGGSQGCRTGAVVGERLE